MSKDPADIELDETDLELLEYIESDFDVSLEELSDQLDLSKSAVHYRLNKLKENGVITGVTADLAPLIFGLDMVALTEISVVHERGYSEEIGEQLSEIDGVEQVYYTMGDIDFMAIVRVQDRDQMNEVIDSIIAIDGVNQTSSTFVMDEIPHQGGVVANLRDDATDRLLDEE
ncbi:Lrp/AsnC family transcriptional regulator [Halobacterium salinarum]|uniref:Lrp/AsnC family transcriptional regulator n=1 Tax=Halobacterium salinarum TaxID=2242 RepID=UPI002553BD18|nr:Lrp/AsnC family transcriptional regulator [Halobacterium salinarum]MDL0135075.1 Lrp/AsnC family transcriptional regulator [Halobacterium salinarum]MDL0135365.1 Lrp/AsnC family transcriptional regulator [Halobacterium salinarum]MDL0138551.1 Lrp/AsnC family transcriptional regulator [Halobacterium salinarum]